MKRDITVIGAAIIDVLAGPVDESVFEKGSQPVNSTRLAFGQVFGVVPAAAPVPEQSGQFSI